jgi:ATP-dependent protease ClpP protease subunit
MSAAEAKEYGIIDEIIVRKGAGIEKVEKKNE